MSQLNIYVPNEMEKAIRAEAKKESKSLSAYLMDVVRGHLQHDKWQDGFFRKVVGGWQGDFPEINRKAAEERDLL